MGEKMEFYFDPEDRHWNNLLKSALNGEDSQVQDGDTRLFLYHREAVIEWQEMANHCIGCMEQLVYNDEFDSVYCMSCDEWRETACEDPSCEYCGERPAKPSMCIDEES